VRSTSSQVIAGRSVLVVFTSLHSPRAPGTLSVPCWHQDEPHGRWLAMNRDDVDAAEQRAYRASRLRSRIAGKARESAFVSRRSQYARRFAQRATAMYQRQARLIDIHTSTKLPFAGARSAGHSVISRAVAKNRVHDAGVGAPRKLRNDESAMVYEPSAWKHREDLAASSRQSTAADDTQDADR